MLFNSYDFIFVFLVSVVLLHRMIAPRFRVWFLVVASVVFYAQWSLFHLFILLFSVGINFFFASLLHRKADRILLFVGIGFNLCLLGYFKYAEFLNLREESILLPLAISFFTFQQIALIVDVYNRRVVVEGFREYLFFVLFFPQLVAGPIVHYGELLGQKKRVQSGVGGEWLLAGCVLFSMGLFKKVVLADNLVRFINNYENSFDAWMGNFCYSFMIYFDFSGYSDMALGLGLLFGVKLPINFLSPYKSRNLIEFWRRWHITLSRFLRDYVYIPLGGSRNGKLNEIFSLLVTMVLGGFWHGAGWNFVVWGFLHGIFLALLHICKIETKRIVGVGVTFLVVSLLWILFGAQNLSEALDRYEVMFSFGGFSGFDWVRESFLVGSFLIVFFMPNSMEIVGYNRDKFCLKRWHLALAGVLLFFALKLMAEAPSRSFVYFNF